MFGEQYAKFEAAPGAFINPELTMGENIADFAGIQVALDAYHRSLGGKPAPVIDGLTGDQRFFLAYAQVWREKQREDALRSQVTSDPHSPGRFRVLGPLATSTPGTRRSGSRRQQCTSRRRTRAHLVSCRRCACWEAGQTRGYLAISS